MPAHPPQTASATSSSAAVALPPRPAKSDSPAATAAPVWSLEGNTNNVDAVPLVAKCDVHNIERSVCCRELKGEDERNLINPDLIRDGIIGLSDGLTVPMALAAGLSTLGSSKIVVVAGMAELVSGCISMGVGGYLSAQAERDHYRYQKKRTRERVLRSCAGEMEREVAAVLAPLGLEESLSRRIAGALLSIEATLPQPSLPPTMFHKFLQSIARRPKYSGNDEERRSLIRRTEEEEAAEDEKGLTAFLLKFGEGLEEVSDSRLFISAFTIGASYFVGGLIPLIPYFIFASAFTGLMWSIAITSVVLLVFGAFKTFYTGGDVGVNGYLYGCLSTLFIGGAAAASSFGIVKLMEGGGL